MSPIIRTLLIGLPVALASLAGAAQSAPPVQGASYASAFEGYQPFAPDTTVQDWRRSNDTVREIGGWRAYAREIASGQAGEAAPGQAPRSSAPEQPRAAHPHMGHHR